MRDAVIVETFPTPLATGQPQGALTALHPIDLLAHARLTIRPLTRADGAAIEAVGAGLSAHSRFLRFHAPMRA
jgi:acetyl-CoA acyltransferase